MLKYSLIKNCGPHITSSKIKKNFSCFPFEAHIPGYQYFGPGTKLKKRLDCGDKGINPLDSACRDHDIVYATSKNLYDRHKADKVLGNRAWERYLFKDTTRKEKFVAYAVANAMKAKRKVGMGCKRKRSIKRNGILAAKKKRNLKKKNGGKRLISAPRQSGDVIPLIPGKPIFAGLSALGSLMSGGASVYNAVQNSKRKKITLSLTENATILSVNYFPPINLYEDSERALLLVDNENNITPMMCFITLEEGCYEIEDIKQRVKKQIYVYNSKDFTDLTFDFTVDPNDFRSSIKCNGILHFEIPYSIAPVFGFEKRVYKPYFKTLRSETTVNLNTINSIKVMCNIARGSFSNHLLSHSIYEFFPSERTGSKVIQSPPNLIYYKFNKTDIDSITVQLVDQDHNPIDNFEVDITRVLGITISLKGYLSGTPDNYNYYENSGWNFKNATQSANDKCEFSACIPLKYWLAKVTLNKIMWKVSHITVDDGERLKLLKLVEKEKSLFIPFRSFETFEYPELGTTKKVVWNLKTASKLEKPQFIIIGLQKGRKNTFTKDCNFTKNNFTLLYDMYTSFQESYYEKSIRNPILSPSTFLTNAPIIVIDTSKQNDSATASAVNVQLEIEA
ncbi:hypothetical protein QTP88_028824 [Uroleucon formosanum]